MPARRPGRTQQIACDRTPLSSATPDVDARVGWLLAMSRLHHPDGDLRDGRAFGEALALAGFPASRSLLSRWEAGSAAVSYEAMTAYERVLALEPGQVTSATGYVKSVLPGPGTHPVRPRLDPATRQFADRLDELIDAAEAGSATARTWQELGWHLTAVPMVHLRGRTWESLAHQLVALLPRSVKGAYRQLSTAAVDLASVPRAQDFLVDAVAAYISDPAVQVADPPLGLLARLPTRKAARLALEVMEKPQDDMTYRAGVRVATDKLRRGDLTPGERAELHMLMVRLWPRDAARAGEEVAELVATLPDAVRAALVAASPSVDGRRLGQVRERSERSGERADDVSASSTGRYCDGLAVAARERAPQDAAYGEDLMLPRLLNEALFHPGRQRRHCAALLLAASPFAAPVADELLGRLTRPTGPAGPPWLRVREARLVRYLCTDAHRPWMLALLGDPVAAVAVPVTEGLGHLTPTRDCDRALRESLADAWSPRGRATLHALGMTGSTAVRRLVRSADAPAWQRAGARWWLDQGGCVRA